MVKINRPKLNNLTIEKILEDNVIFACILICLYLFVPLEALEGLVKLEVILSRRELFRVEITKHPILYLSPFPEEFYSGN